MFFKRWGILASIAFLVFIVWVIFGMVGKGHTTLANILGVVAVIFSIAAMFNLRDTTPVTDWSKFVSGSVPLLVALVLLTYFLNRELTISWFPEVIVAYGTLFLAAATFQLGQTTKNENGKLIAENKKLADENQKIREEDKARESKRRRLEEIKHWVEGVAALSIVGGSSGSTGHVAAQERSDQLGLLLASEEYLILEAKRLDFDLNNLNLQEEYKGTTEVLIKDIISVLRQWMTIQIWGDPPSRKTVWDKCAILLKIVSDTRAEMKL